MSLAVETDRYDARTRNALDWVGDRAEEDRAVVELSGHLAQSQLVLSEEASRATLEFARQQGIDTTGGDLIEATALVSDPDTLDWYSRLLLREDNLAKRRQYATQWAIDTQREAEEIQLASIPTITGFVRYLRPDASRTGTCARCAVLAGRVYRWSEGFYRHENCKCLHVPVGDDPPDGYVIDVDKLLREGKIRGLNKHELAAYLEDNVDLQDMVNRWLKNAGLRRDGYVLRRSGKMTPAAIRMAYPDDTPEHREMRRKLYRANGYTIGGEGRSEVSREAIEVSGNQTKGLQERLQAGMGGGKPPSEPPEGRVSPVPDEPDEYPEMRGGGSAPFKPSDRPDINADTVEARDVREHILERHARGGTDGTQFPPSWSPTKVFRAVDSILALPGTIWPRGQFLVFYGTYEAVRVIVRLERQTRKIETAHPVEGPGVTRNGANLPLGSTRYKGVQW